MIDKIDYKKILKEHAKLKIVSKPLNENGREDVGIMKNIKIKVIEKKILDLENKIQLCNNKKDKVMIEMLLKKEKAKLKHYI